MIQDDWEKRVSEISQGFAVLMGNMDAQWLVRPETMPRVDWRKYKSASRHLDLLVVTMVAMGIGSFQVAGFKCQDEVFPVRGY